MSGSSFNNRRRQRRRQRRFLGVGVLGFLGVLLFAALAFVGGGSDPETEAVSAREDSVRESPADGADTATAGKDETRKSTAQVEKPDAEKPEAVKGVYVSGLMASTPAMEDYIKLAEDTEVNALVIDVKEAGEIMYQSDVPLAEDIGATTNYIKDLEGLVKELESRGVYPIARLAVFQDDVLPRERPDLAVQDSTTGAPWLTYAGATWSNAYRKEVWEYNVAIAKEAAEAGFKEIQFDYVRFPSDGPMANLSFGEETYPTQSDAIAGFLEYAHGELEPMGVEVGADVFGLVGMNDEVGVGQVVSKMAPHLDVLSPMVYPSHYLNGNYGYPNPNAEPYGVIAASMKDFKTKAKPVNSDLEIRPWLQDFDLGYPDYGAAEVQAQIKATYDSDLSGWLLWNAANEYTETALEPAEPESGKSRP